MSGGSKRFLIPWLVCLLLVACGDPTEPPEGTGGTGGGTGGVGGTGGSGGDGGSGGTGGTGGDPILPEVDRIDPEAAGRGFRVRVLGKNFASPASANALLFSGTSGAPSVAAVGLAGAPDGTWFEVEVPHEAQSGPTLVTVDTAEGEVSVTSPDFTVTEDKLPPQIQSITPSQVTALGKSVPVTITGTGFYPSATTVEINGEEQVIDWADSGPTRIRFTIGERWLERPGTLVVTVHNPPPGGGTAGPEDISVVAPLNVVRAYAIREDQVRVEFDRPVDSQQAFKATNFSIQGRQQAVADSRRLNWAPHVVELTLDFSTVPGERYTVVANSLVVSEEGGEIGNRSVEFRGYGSLPELEEEIGTYGCGNDGFADPTSVVLLEDRLLVTERLGNQVQVVDLDGNLVEYFGHDGSSFGLHASGTASGCGAPEAPAGLAGPLGATIRGPDTWYYVADTGNDRILKFTASADWSVLATGLTPPAVVLGSVPGIGLYVTSGPGKVDVLRWGSGQVDRSIGNPTPGTGRGEFDFTMTEGGLPAMSRGADAAYIAEPGNHRVQRLRNFLQPNGSIGKGSMGFGGEASGEPGTAPGEFTRPCGVAVGEGPDSTAGKSLYVVDEAGGGRLQRFHEDGTFHWEFSLDYLPGGVAVDEEKGVLWITNRTEHKLMRYSLY